MELSLVDEIDCGNFFDQIDDLIEFPPDSNDGNLVSIDDCKDFSKMCSDVLPDNVPLFSSNHINSSSDLSAELSVPYEDIVQLEWLSTFVEDSFSGAGMTIGKENVQINQESSLHQKFKTSHPVSELESSSSSSSSSGEKATALYPAHCGPQRARSKRPRPSTFNPRAAIQLTPLSSPTIRTNNEPLVAHGLSSGSDNLVQLPPTKKIQKPAGDQEQKKKKIKITPPSDPMASSYNSPIRKCLHCEITKTPQWRAGPMGPKTLCNACGVRHKSGRLFPEYRPAASPTFIPSMHSNSHKKVLEMRSSVGSAITPTIES